VRPECAPKAAGQSPSSPRAGMGRRRFDANAVEFKVIARRAAAVFGGTAKVMRYKDDAEVNWVDVLGWCGPAESGVTAYATIGLSRYDNQLTSGSRPLRVELLGACASKVQTFAGMLASCAFNIRVGRVQPDAGRDLPDIVSMYEPTPARSTCCLCRRSSGPRSRPKYR